MRPVSSAPVEEREGDAVAYGQPFTGLGPVLRPGLRAVDFTLDHFGPGRRRHPPRRLLHRSEDFGGNYGVLIKEWRELQRSLFVIDRAGRLSHPQYVSDQDDQPDYDEAVAAVIQLAGGAPAGGPGRSPRRRCGP